MYSPDYRWIVSGYGDGTIRMWDAQTREPIGDSLSCPFGAIYSLALSPDGRRMVSRSGRSIVVWDVKAFTGKQHTLSSHKLNINILFPDAGLEPHPSFINFKSTTASSAENPSGLSATPRLKTWNGWITDKAGSLVMWVPDEYRGSLLWRGMIRTLGRESPAIDFRNAFYGKGWMKCYQPQASA